MNIKFPDIKTAIFTPEKISLIGKHGLVADFVSPKTAVIREYNPGPLNPTIRRHITVQIEHQPEIVVDEVEFEEKARFIYRGCGPHDHGISYSCDYYLSDIQYTYDLQFAYCEAPEKEVTVHHIS